MSPGASRPSHASRTEHPETPGLRDQADELLAQWLEEHAGHDEQAFEELCRLHPDLREELIEGLADLRVATRELGSGCFSLGQDLKADAGRLSTGFGAPGRLLHAARSHPALTGLCSLGVRVGRYRPRERLGEGASAEVLLADDTLLGRQVALKVLRPAAIDERGDELWRVDRVLRFRREMELLAGLEHPGIVGLLDAGLDDQGRPFLVMPYIEGRNLSEVIEDARAGRDGWSVSRVVLLLEQVCAALARAHERHIVHRDLKPTNIRVGTLGEVVVLDWGLARDIDAAHDGEDSVSPGGIDGGSDTDVEAHAAKVGASGSGAQGGEGEGVGDGGAGADAEGSPRLTREGSVLGTPAYMAPEQRRGGLSAVGIAADVYAVGAMLFELLTGRPPHLGARGAGVQAVPDLELLDRVEPPELASVARKALQAEPDRRYGNVQALREDLVAWIDGRVVAAHPTGFRQVARKWMGRNRLAAGLLGVLALGGVLGLLLLVSSGLAVRRARDKARAHLADYEQLADVTRAESLVSEADALAPDWPESIPAKRRWLERVDALLAQWPRRLATLESLRPLVAGAGESAAGDAAAAGHGGDRMELRFRYDRLLDLEDAIAALRRKRAEMLRRIERIAHLAVAVPADVWSAAADRVRVSPRYGFELSPQRGLIPLGPDPLSGLEEFAVAATGIPPVRPRGGGALQATQDSALVLVLLPALRGAVGCRRIGPGESPGGHASRWADEDESPVFEARRPPFLVSKYEMTQNQWHEAFGTAPSVNMNSQLDDPKGRLPVNMVTVEMAGRTLLRFGLRLPDEVEWELFARAGTVSDWWTGAEPDSLVGAANLADVEGDRSEAEQGRDPGRGLPDGFRYSAPVGSFRPNGFGLFDVLGNVAELTSSPYAPYPLADGAGRRPLSGQIVIRGGSYRSGPLFARASYRNVGAPDRGSYDVGVRPVRDLDGSVRGESVDQGGR